MRALDWHDGKVRFIDQTRLPRDEVFIETNDYRIVGEAIRKLQIRGAPAIGVAAAFGVLLAVDHSLSRSLPELRTAVDQSVDELSRTRPTAVNLFSALDRMRAAFSDAERDGLEAAKARLRREAFAIQEEDIQACRAIGDYGAALIPPGSSVLTHCNTGALATAGEGTALSVVTTAARQGKIVRVFVDETRPLLQGSRLTTWELVRLGIPVTLMTDATAGTVLAQGKVHAVVVGADRIAANGDTANKIGTYPLAVLARRHSVPFYVAAPTSTIDARTAAGRDIPIEERDPHEVTHVAGIRVAAHGADVYAPAFDVTPNDLISAFVTEKGILERPYTLSIAAVLA